MMVCLVSKVLQGPEIRYPRMEKLAFSMVLASRRLRPYFRAHTITVYTNKYLKQVLYKYEASGRLLK